MMIVVDEIINFYFVKTNNLRHSICSFFLAVIQIFERTMYLLLAPKITTLVWDKEIF